MASLNKHCLKFTFLLETLIYLKNVDNVLTSVRRVGLQSGYMFPCDLVHMFYVCQGVGLLSTSHNHCFWKYLSFCIPGQYVITMLIWNKRAVWWWMAEFYMILWCNVIWHVLLSSNWSVVMILPYKSKYQVAILDNLNPVCLLIIWCHANTDRHVSFPKFILQFAVSPRRQRCGGGTFRIDDGLLRSDDDRDKNGYSLLLGASRGFLISFIRTLQLCSLVASLMASCQYSDL